MTVASAWQAIYLHHDAFDSSGYSSLVFWIHGGGWHRGDKSNVDQKPQAFVDQGFVFISGFVVALAGDVPVIAAGGWRMDASSSSAA